MVLETGFLFHEGLSEVGETEALTLGWHPIARPQNLPRVILTMNTASHSQVRRGKTRRVPSGKEDGRRFDSCPSD